MKTIMNKPNVVALMRTIRNQFSLEIQNMSLEEEKEYMQKIIQGRKNKRNAHKKG